VSLTCEVCTQAIAYGYGSVSTTADITGERKNLFIFGGRERCKNYDSFVSCQDHHGVVGIGGCYSI
jgi:hypothetical protein